MFYADYFVSKNGKIKENLEFFFVELRRPAAKRWWHPIGVQLVRTAQVLEGYFAKHDVDSFFSPLERREYRFHEKFIQPMLRIFQIKGI